MRPPVLPGGNGTCQTYIDPWRWRFNEAAGFTRRKPGTTGAHCRRAARGFNEAAGFTRRKPWGEYRTEQKGACFNEAAGFTRRKR